MFAITAGKKSVGNLTGKKILTARAGQKNIDNHGRQQKNIDNHGTKENDNNDISGNVALSVLGALQSLTKTGRVRMLQLPSNHKKAPPTPEAHRNPLHKDGCAIQNCAQACHE